MHKAMCTFSGAPQIVLVDATGVILLVPRLSVCMGLKHCPGISLAGSALSFIRCLDVPLARQIIGSSLGIQNSCGVSIRCQAACASGHVTREGVCSEQLALKSVKHRLL
jgi:hypothetical protein